ncbi:MAG: class I adenylate-forming enzyme family protein [Desulfobacteraceae bacterium]
MQGVRPYPQELFESHCSVWLGITVIDAFDRTCDILPEKVAVVYGETRLTFAQLREKVQKAALVFLDLGLGKEGPVLLHIPNSVEAIYVYLALDMIGAVPVLCLPRHGQRELERFGALTESTTWIGQSRYGKIEYLPMVKAVRENCPSLRNIVVVGDEAPTGTLSLSKLTEGIQLGPRTDEHLSKSRPTPQDVLHLAPTGGTTGLPKLVPRTHNAHLCKAYYWARAQERGPKEVDLVVAPINHDAPQLSHLAFMALFGGTLVFCPLPRPRDILEYLEREKITFSFMVPTLLTDLANEPGVEEFDFSPNLKLGYGGAYASPDLIQTICRRFGCDFYSIYGMTEGAGTITRSTDSPELIANTVGKGMCPYDEYKLVDDHGNEMPSGKEGEVAFRGPSMSSGYYKSEEEDKLVFTQDGFFRTGDMGRFDPLGNLIITGRKKDIIRRGGETIIPFEIEQMISEHPKVSQTVVVGMPDARLGERICAYIQPIRGEKLSFEDLVSYLKEKGASKMLLPERIELLEELPLTPMQKVDKKALREDITRKLKQEQEEGK